MSEWEITSLGEICKKVITGGTPLSKNEDFFRDGTIPWLKTKEVNFCRIRKTESHISELGLANSSARLIPENSVIVAMYGQGDTAGRVAINEIPLTTNQACCNLVIDEKSADYNFVYFYLKNSYRELVNAKTGSAQPNLNTQIVKEFPITLPLLQEQKEIAAVLTSLDRKIENLRKQNETLEAIAQTLFKHWFVDFEFPNADGKPYKSSGGAMEPSELGDIPAGWCASTLGNEFDIAIGRTPPRKESEWFSTNATDIKWVSIKDMGSCGTYIFKTSEYLTREAVDQFNIPVIPANTVILSFKLTVGRVAITPEEMLSNEAIAHIKTSSDSIPSEYIYLFLSQFNFGKLGNTSSIATAVNSKSIKALEIIAPDSGIISKFYATVKPLFEKLKVNSQQIQTLTKTRDVLLPKLMSGKLRIKD